MSSGPVPLRMMIWPMFSKWRAEGSFAIEKSCGRLLGRRPQKRVDEPAGAVPLAWRPLLQVVGPDRLPRAAPGRTGGGCWPCACRADGRACDWWCGACRRSRTPAARAPNRSSSRAHSWPATHCAAIVARCSRRWLTARYRRSSAPTRGMLPADSPAWPRRRHHRPRTLAADALAA